MRLLTWNIQWGCGRDGRIDLVRIAREIEVHAPDVVCLQEVVRGFPTLTGDGQERDDQPRVLAELFTGWAHAYVAALEQVDERGSRRQFGNMILSRLPLIEVRRHALPMPADPSVPAMPRAALECTLHAPLGPLTVVTTHLEYYSARQRLAQVDALRRLLAENAAHAAAPRPPGGPDEPHFAAPPRAADTILCGDFNCPPDSPELTRLCMPLQPAECAAAGFDATAAVPPPLCFRDAWRIAHGDAPHAPSAGLVASADFPAPVCFDFAFVAGALAARLQTIRVDAATAASDHQPLIVDFASPHGF